MKFAPVLICTCNRYLHLKELLESLENNTHAEKTDVYISMDFPPSEKYNEGYNQVKEYLEIKSINHNFNKLVIYKQEFNRGPYENFQFLIKEIRKLGYDRFILLEDDNIFARSFWDFTNKGLEIAEKESDIIGTCGYNVLKEVMMQNTAYLRSAFTYGCAFLINKYDELCQKIDLKEFEKLLQSPMQMIRINRWSKKAFDCLVWGLICASNSPFLLKITK